MSSSDQRFGFGKNWKGFLKCLNEERIKEAELTLTEKLGELKGLKFLDIGSGSGLFSLAARRLGAHVHSFDYDTDSVACTESLKNKFFPNDPNWQVERGDALNPSYLEKLGQFDVVYSWGVLHHTGDMWKAFELVGPLVKKEGLLYISIYHDQGKKSIIWRRIKKFYNQSPAFIRAIMIAGFMLRSSLCQLIRFQNPISYVINYKKSRGMSYFYDVIDWVGGYPFEVATPEAVFHFFLKRGFTLNYLKTVNGGSGCNEYVFKKG